MRRVLTWSTTRSLWRQTYLRIRYCRDSMKIMNTDHALMERNFSSRITLGARGRMVLPQKIIKRLGLRAGAELNMVERDNIIMLVPQKISHDQKWYMRPRWQKMMRNAFSDVKNGRIAGPFKNAEDLITELRS